MSEQHEGPFRVGGHVGRTIYQRDPDGCRESLVGMFDTLALAKFAAHAMNQCWQLDCRPDNVESPHDRQD